MMKMPDNFFVFGDGYVGDGYDNVREDIWKRSRGPGPTALNDPGLYHPRILIPEYYRNDCPEIYTFEMAKEYVEWEACKKLNRSTLERGYDKNNGSTSSSHRRIYHPGIEHSERWLEQFVRPNGKVQVEHNRSFRIHTNRRGTSSRAPSYRLEEMYKKHLEPTHLYRVVKGKQRLIPTQDESYRRRVFEVVCNSGSFTKSQIDELHNIWRTVARGYVVGSDPDGLLTCRETSQIKRLATMRKKEGMVRTVQRTERFRAKHRDNLFNYLRLCAKRNGMVWIPSCEICNSTHGPDCNETLSAFECSHRNPISNGERETVLGKDLMLLCNVCHGIYTYNERIALRIGLFNCDGIKATVRLYLEKHG